VCCAFSFCWQALLAEHPGQPAPPDPQAATVAARGAEATGIGAEPAVSSSWPVALRAVRAWLIPWNVLALLAVVVTSTAARQLQRLLDAVAAGQPLHLYLPP
jgi:hypothetical protein